MRYQNEMLAILSDSFKGYLRSHQNIDMKCEERIVFH